MRPSRLPGGDRWLGCRDAKGLGQAGAGNGAFALISPLFSGCVDSREGRPACHGAWFLAPSRLTLTAGFAGRLSQSRTPEGAPHRGLRAPLCKAGTVGQRSSRSPLPAEVSSDVRPRVAFPRKPCRCAER